MSVKWYGAAITKKIKEAAAVGINNTMAAAVTFAKNNHPGWKNITGAAEGSIRVPAGKEAKNNHLVGTWGSVAVDYFKYLEFKHGHALIRAADVEYRGIVRRIREAFV